MKTWAYFTYEYVTIHLFLSKVEKRRRSGNHSSASQRVNGPISPEVGIERQLEQRLGLEGEKRSEKPELGKKGFGVGALVSTSGERELTINATLWDENEVSEKVITFNWKY